MTKEIKAKKLIDRISRIEGQLRGIRRMLEGEAECLDVMAQVMAIREAVSVLGVEIIKDDFVCKCKSNNKIDEKYLKTIFKIKN